MSRFKTTTDIARLILEGKYKSPNEEIAEYFLENATSGGQAAGSVEVVKTSPEKAVDYASRVFQKPVQKVIPNFESNFIQAQNRTKLGKTKRKDMPVIGDDEVVMLQWSLERGMIDIVKPWAADTNPRNPWPNGITKDRAHKFLTAGIRDGQKLDDVVKARLVTVTASKLVPIQKQIYLDKCLPPIAKFGVKGTVNFLETSTMVLSSDYHIIDGHHRWMSSLLIDPSMKLRGIMFDLPIKKFLPLARTYGDAEGHRRNM